MLTFQYAKNPIYGNAEGTCIILTVKWEEFNEELPFGATSYDPMGHGVELYTRAKAGEFGEIAAFEPASMQPQPKSTGTQTL